MNASIILGEAGEVAGWVCTPQPRRNLDPNGASNPTLWKRWMSAKLDQVDNIGAYWFDDSERYP